jgi:hypothetical protein
VLVGVAVATLLVALGWVWLGLQSDDGFKVGLGVGLSVVGVGQLLLARRERSKPSND